MILSKYINQKIDKDPIDSIVKVWIDPNIINGEFLDNQGNPTSEAHSFLVNTQFLNSTTSKKSRVKLVEEKIKNKEWLTIQEIMHELSVTRPTAITYCRELGITVWDAAKKKYVGYSADVINKKSVGNILNSHFVYYDRDPDLPDARIIDSAEHCKLLVAARQKVINNR